MPDSARSPRQLDLDGRCQLARTLLRRGVRQIGVLRATSAGIAQAPTIDERAGALERAREELLQLERSAELYAETTGADLLADAQQMVGELPTPTSWVEAALAQLHLCLAAQVELENRNDTGTEPEALLALARAAEHVNAARAALHEAKAFAADQAELVRDASARWLAVALRTLEEEATREIFSRTIECILDPDNFGVRH